MLDSLLGAGASQAILGIGSIGASQQQANSTVHNAQLQAQYSQAQQARFNTAKWVFNGRACTVQEFANAIWPGEHEDKMLFLLTHSGPPVAESTR